MPPKNSLRVDGIYKSYGPVRALRGVGFAVEAGEIFGYLGPNGAGKTTTLRVILGLVRADKGGVEILGSRAGRAANRAAIGFLPGELNLYGAMTGTAVLDYFAGFRTGRPPVLRPRLLEKLGVPPAVLERKVKQLSHGTRQKLGLLIAMQHDPELLLLDEPTIGLDPLVQMAFREIVLDFAGRGRSVLFSSHVLSEVEAVAHRVAILRAGEIVAVETVANLRSRMVRRLEVAFAGPPPADLARTPGVARIERTDTAWVLWVLGDVNPVLRRLAGCDLARFVFPEPELEDIFLTYYRENHENDA